MDTISLELPANLLETARLTPAELKTELALLLYQQERIPYAQAAALAGNADGQFDRLLQEKERQSETEQIDLSEFLSWASHDLKTPLNAVIGFSKVVLKGIDGPVNEMQVTDLTSVHANGQRMLALISNLVDMARINRGEAKISFDSANVVPVIEEAAARWKAQNPAKELVTVSLVTSPSLLMQLDASRIRQTVANLLTYAALYIEDQGQLTFTLEEDDKQLNLSIKSAGAKTRGVSKMDITMLNFISRSLLELHGGKLLECQESETGANIRFVLPKT
ncbi:MAG: sensor histidine kinase [Chloroflexi bacterium]|nr:MAG: sensor histidine kinase [Chloroflexota bacterium]